MNRQRSHARSRAVAGLLVVIGIYVLVQPFDLSPGTCFRIWADPINSIRNCATSENLAPAFWLAVVFGAAGVVVGAVALLRR
jgi:hypothetical protein